MGPPASGLPGEGEEGGLDDPVEEGLVFCRHRAAQLSEPRGAGTFGFGVRG